MQYGLRKWKKDRKIKEKIEVLIIGRGGRLLQLLDASNSKGSVMWPLKADKRNC